MSNSFKLSITQKRMMQLYYAGLTFMLINMPLFAADLTGGKSTLKTIISSVLGVMVLVSFPWGVIMVWSSVKHIKAGDNAEGKNGIIAGMLLALGPLITFIIYAAAYSGFSGISVNFD